MMDETIIRIEDLTKVYGEKVAVDHLNLSIQRGEIFGLLGPNGAGKTTTNLMLLGLTEPTGGHAEIDGHDCSRETMVVKRLTGYMPDHAGFYQELTGRENLRFLARLNGLDEQEIDPLIDRLLQRVGLSQAADQKSGTYSRGMKQRLSIAAVLVKDPEVIIMDEPTLGLDPEGMREFLQLIRTLGTEEGKTILISSHQLFQVQQICDRVGIFSNGRLIACGTIDELGSQLASEGHYLLELKAKPLDERLMDYISGLDEACGIKKEEDRLLIRSREDLRGPITRFMGMNDYTLLLLHQKGGDLDEIYRSYFEEADRREEGEADERTGSHRRFFGRR